MNTEREEETKEETPRERKAPRWWPVDRGTGVEMRDIDRRRSLRIGKHSRISLCSGEGAGVTRGPWAFGSDPTTARGAREIETGPPPPEGGTEGRVYQNGKEVATGTWEAMLEEDAVEEDIETPGSLKPEEENAIRTWGRKRIGKAMGKLAKSEDACDVEKHEFLRKLLYARGGN